MYPGRSEDVKQQLADAIVRNVLSVVQCDEKWISVVVEEIDSAEWPEKVYKPEILDKQDSLYKKPGYNPFE
jgi:4-oxalocrotonate tautomerase